MTTSDDQKGGRVRGPALTNDSRVSLTFRGPQLSLPGEPAVETRAPFSSLPPIGADDALAGTDAWTLARPTPLPAATSSVPPARSASPSERSRERRKTELPMCAGHAIELVDSRSDSVSSEPDLEADMAERFALGDFSGALHSAEILLGHDPEHASAARYAASCRGRLEQIYSSRFGHLDRVLRASIPEAEVRWLGLDPQAAFLLSRVDGVSTIDELIEVSAMPRLACLRILVELLDAGAVVTR